VPSTERVKISSTNVRLETIVHQKEKTFQVIIDVIKNSTCYKTFTISADVPEIFMQQFRKILDICPRVEGEEFTKVQDDDATLTFLIDLGYKGLLQKYTNILKFVRIREDYQEYGLPIPDMMLNDTIIQSESYQMFLKYSTGQIPPKKSRGKGSQGKKTTDTHVADVDVSKESEPEPAKKRNASKSISLIEAAEEEAARQVYATHARIVTEYVPKPARRRSSDPP
ncbi:hypothetical protein Tco_0838888, partial [Tanacetum coccineum]